MMIKESLQRESNMPKPASISRHYIEIINIPTVMLAMQLPFSILVQLIQIDIAKQLTCKIANRKSFFSCRLCFHAKGWLPSNQSKPHPELREGLAEA